MEYPKTFEDTKQRKWTVAITWGTFGRVKDATGIDLDGIVPKKGAKKEDNELAIEKYLDLIYSSTAFPLVLFAILDAQMKQAGVSPADLADAFDDATVDVATKAFHQALSDFIRDPQLRKPFQAIMQGVEKAVARIEKKIDDRLPQAMEAMLASKEAEMDRQLDAILQSTSTTSQVS